MTTAFPRVLLVAGEASGDLLGAHLAQAITTLNARITLIGMGGPHMQSAGVDLFIDARSLAVVGASEILTQLGSILAAMRRLKKLFKTAPPELVIFIDYPGFNLRMAKYAKRAGCRVLYYISPQIWAWRYRRIKKIKRYVDRIAVLLAFEEPLYQKENIPVTWVGHPIIDIARPTLPPQTVYEQWSLTPEKPLIALFPGSRINEINKLMPIIIKSVQLIRQQIPEAQFILPLASSLSIHDIQKFLIPDIQVIEKNTYNLLPLCHAAITASGTATLEIALHQVPMVIIYKISAFSYWLAKRLVKVPFVGLCNLVAEESVALELLQKAAQAETITKEIIRLIKEDNYRQNTLIKLARIKDKLGGSGASHKVAQLALQILNDIK
ncbi:MAG: lipid-A-disaccharide synthase [Coxiella sp. RIFCSPHIGHO2_12_FULL_44_14]|nr:MAG: lipid-A-disaccharide synthase [Coxiella sp. RIFCSPHIGHO2_12_FULL_44_14]